MNGTPLLDVSLDLGPRDPSRFVGVVRVPQRSAMLPRLLRSRNGMAVFNKWVSVERERRMWMLDAGSLLRRGLKCLRREGGEKRWVDGLGGHQTLCGCSGEGRSKQSPFSLPFHIVSRSAFRRLFFFPSSPHPQARPTTKFRPSTVEKLQPYVPSFKSAKERKRVK